MQVKALKSDGLVREFRITVPANDVAESVENRLAEMSKTLRLPGFRPGKIPLPVVRQRYGREIRNEVVAQLIETSTEQALVDQKLRPALRPHVENPDFAEGKDLEYTVSVEIIPEIAPMDFRTLNLERLTADVEESAVTESLERLAKSTRQSAPVAAGESALKGDLLVIDFDGTAEGKAWPGMKASDYHLELGSGRFIDGFEAQLEGAKAGDARTVKVKFPADYTAKELAGKSAEFAVTIKDIRRPADVVLDDSLAGKFGLDTLATLKQKISEQIAEEYKYAARTKLKRALMDALAKTHDFQVPPSMVKAEFDTIWSQLQQEYKASNSKPEDEGKSWDGLEKEYRDIAVRRIRLGLLLADIGHSNKLTVSQEEVTRAVINEARRYPGSEKAVFDYYKNRGAVEQLRAPLFEDKVVDFILGLATITERKVPVATLLAEEEA